MSIDSHGLEVGRDYELSIGSSFQSTGRTKEKDAYHLMRYDFKPASIDTSRPAHFEVGENKQCTVTLPNIQESGSTTTTYKGGKKPCTKECVLIIDKQTGQITLERITSMIPLKKCRNDKQSMVPKAHSEMENMETMEKSMNLKKMLKGRDKSQQPKADKAEKKGASSSSSSKQSKDGSQQVNNNNTKPSKHSSQHVPPNSSLNTSIPPPTQQSAGALNAAVNSTPGVPANGSKINPNVPPGGRTRLMSSSDMSVSSASSDSSDSDSSDEGGEALKAQLAMAAKAKHGNVQPKVERSPAKPMPTNAVKVERSPVKAAQSAPLAKEATVKGKEKAFLSTLQCDLHLSDSSDSD